MQKNAFLEVSNPNFTGINPVLSGLGEGNAALTGVYPVGCKKCFTSGHRISFQYLFNAQQLFLAES
ncbi:hypothetical protein BC351_24810 [Paenibacillus ferrarius]|uniref:Uncharacterized protein n=1 Tax=Paenibacillus ferrarius TaxID=1469647 RepID=A0A1V4HLJ8_9BACL|nr:hypothetical protein BC351_24810 [Paenibacillus ferrarius]